jgi:hypothetical protein
MEWANELGYINGVKSVGFDTIKLTNTADGYELSDGQYRIVYKPNRVPTVNRDRLRIAEEQLLRHIWERKAIQ